MMDEDGNAVVLARTPGQPAASAEPGSSRKAAPHIREPGPVLWAAVKGYVVMTRVWLLCSGMLPSPVLAEIFVTISI